ncbi:merozoite surface protein 9-like [Palaemon carinicauda]|uniref:merozoite surface protein 9-like n=1 Tax=Palaemon carinicauda TaxID=392227 RepID=UPI0035B67760
MKAAKDVEAGNRRIAAEENLLKLKMMAEEKGEAPHAKELEARREEREAERERKNEKKPKRFCVMTRSMKKKAAAEKEEREIEGAMNFKDLFSEEEDSLDGTQG